MSCCLSNEHVVFVLSLSLSVFDFERHLSLSLSLSRELQFGLAVEIFDQGKIRREGEGRGDLSPCGYWGSQAVIFAGGSNGVDLFIVTLSPMFGFGLKLRRPNLVISI